MLKLGRVFNLISGPFRRKYLAARLVIYTLLILTLISWPVPTFAAPPTLPTGEVHHPIRVVTPPSNPRLKTTTGITPNLFNGTVPDFSPAQIRKAYGIDQLAGTGVGKTIAIIDAYGSPTLEADVAVFNTQFNLPQFSNTDPALPDLTIAYPGGAPTTQDEGWALETALDVEWAHAIAPGADILVVIARTASYSDLLNAVNYANNYDQNVDNVDAVSMSWGGGEFSSEGDLNPLYFSNAGTIYVAASGDYGAGVMWPSSSPNVVAVGGTTLTTAGDGTYISETAWSGSGGGQSLYENRPAYQSVEFIDSGITKRSVPDVSFVADPYSGVSVYHNGTWYQVGGTSLSAPCWAALYTLGSQSTVSFIYSQAAGSSYAQYFQDITSGSSSANGSNPAIPAAAGYDMVTGLGSPKAGINLAFTTGAKTVIAGIASTAITIQSQGFFNNADNVTADTTISLTSTSPAGKFDVVDSGPFTTTSINIASGSSSKNFYYKDTTAGTPTITVSGTAISSITQTATINAASASQVRVETAANGSGTLVPAQILNSGSTLMVYGVTRDQYGNYAGNPADTAWSLTNRNGGVLGTDLSASPASSVTLTGNAGGSAVIHAINGALTAGDSGVITVISGSTVDHLTIDTHPASTLTVDAAFSTAAVITAFDASNNPVQWASIMADRDPSTGTGTIRGTSTVVTDASGHATFSNLAYNKTDAFKVRFTSNNGKTAISNQIGPLSAGAPTQVKVETAADGSETVVATQSLVAGNTLTAYGITRDQFSNYVGNPADTAWSLTSKTGGVADTDLSSASGASVTFIAHLIGTAKIHAVNGALTASDSGTLTVTTGPVDHLTINTHPSSILSVDSSFSTAAVVTANDVGNNPVNGVSITADRDPATGTGALRGNLSVTTASNGQATFSNLAYNKTDVFKVRFTSNTKTVISNQLGPLTAGAPTALAISTAPAAGASVDANLVTQPVISVVDQFTNPVGGITVTASRVTGTGTLRGTLTSVSAPGTGLAAFTNLGYNKSGEAFTIRFTLNSLTADSASLGPLSPGSPAKLAFTTQPANAVAGATFSVSPAVVVQDAYGNTTNSTAQITLAITSGTGTAGAVLSGTKTSSAVNGQAAFAGLNISAAGNGYTLTAASTGLTSAVSSAFIVSAPVVVVDMGGGGYVGGGGGGGGGGAGGGDLREYLTSYFSAPGVFASNATSKSYDGIATLQFAKGTTFKTAEGWAGSYITMEPLKENLPPAPPSGNIIGLVYKLGPEGAAFDPPITLKLIYKPEQIPSGMNAGNLVIGYWDGKQWQSLESTVNAADNTITAKISHFSEYSVLAELPPPPPTRFVTGIRVTPTQVGPGETVTITATVSNLGGSPGTNSVTFKVNSAPINSRDVSLDAGQSQTVTFQVKEDAAGTYNVDVNGESGRFTVVVPTPTPAPTPTPEATLPSEMAKPLLTAQVGPSPTPTPSPALSSSPTVTASSPAPSPSPENRPPTPLVNWGLMVGIIIAVVVLVLGTIIVLRTRKK